MRFVHVTDTHIGADPGYAKDGHSAHDNLVALVNAVNDLRFPIDFVLHTGDVVEDRSEEAYRVARGVLCRLRLPVYYVAGNHDDADRLQRVLLGSAAAGPRFDYRLTIDGIVVAVFDTRGPNDPAGTLTGEQLAAVEDLCVPEGPPLVIALHHPPLPLDTPWLDDGWQIPSGRTANMLLDRGADFLQAVAPARDRLRGVFFGHVHRAFQVIHRGILYASAPSGFGQLLTWADQARPEPSPGEPPGFSIVTITADRTIVRQHALVTPLPPVMGKPHS